MIVGRRLDGVRWTPWLIVLVALLGPLLLVASGAGMFLLVDSLALRALILLSPDNVFFCTPTEPFYIVPELIFWFPIGLMAPFLLLWTVPRYRRSALDNAELRELWSSVIGSRSTIAIFGMYVTMVPVYLFALSSNVCLSASEIYYRPNIFFPLQIYALSQIAEVRPQCTKGPKFAIRASRSGPMIGLEIRMTDTTSFNIAAVKPVYLASSERILDLLQNVPLNNSEIDHDCPDDLKMLITPR